MAEHLHSSFIPGCFRCAIGLDKAEPDSRISILRKDLEQLIAALEDCKRLQKAMKYADHNPTCPAWADPDSSYYGSCDCGWDQLRAMLEKRL